MTSTRAALGLLLAGLLLVGNAVRSPAADDKTDKAPSLDGKWKVTKAELGGEELPMTAWSIQAFEFSEKKAKLTESLLGDVETKDTETRV